MNNFSQALASTSKRKPTPNPLAQALAETEREKRYSSPQATNTQTNPFSEALARTGANPNSYSDLVNNTPLFDQQQQQQELIKQQKKEALRKKLHDQVNPVDTRDVFSARERKVKQEIEQIRQELQLLAKDFKKFYQNIDQTLYSQQIDPGIEGTYYTNFFHQLKSFIMLLRQKLNSANTWATQLQAKGKKKRQKQGLMIGGAGHEKTSTVQDMMHHERSTQYTGG
jgi:hypothetical protein